MLIFKTQGTCSREIQLEVDGEIIKSINIIGGCGGNLSGLTTLIVGQKAADIIQKLRGIDCGGRGTSCPDQIAKALEQALAQGA